MLDAFSETENRAGLKVTVTRVIGIGQPIAGDDGVGIAVTQALRHTKLPYNVDIVTLGDPVDLIEQLRGAKHVILVDAVIGDQTPGSIAFLTVDDLADNGYTPVSSHGISIVQAIHIARALTPKDVAADIQILAIFIDIPKQNTFELSANITAAIPKAVTLLRQIIGAM